MALSLGCAHEVEIAVRKAGGGDEFWDLLGTQHEIARDVVFRAHECLTSVREIFIPSSEGLMPLNLRLLRFKRSRLDNCSRDVTPRFVMHELKRFSNIGVSGLQLLNDILPRWGDATEVVREAGLATKLRKADMPYEVVMARHISAEMGDPDGDVLLSLYRFMPIGGNRFGQVVEGPTVSVELDKKTDRVFPLGDGTDHRYLHFLVVCKTDEDQHWTNRQS